MTDISPWRAMAVPTAIMVAMLASAILLAAYADVDGTRIFLPYLSGWAGASVIAVLLWAFIEVARMARGQVDRPIPTLVRCMQVQQGLFLLPALIFPLFIGAYTWAKCSIPFVVGYGWERAWADADLLIFGTDAWRPFHQIMPASLAKAWTFFYAVIWGLALGVVGSLVSAFASHRFTAAFFTAMMLSWFIGGFIAAYAVSAGGPVFAHLTDASLAGRFAPLREQLIALLGRDDIVLESQRYLAAGLGQEIALKGGGISAMPSMHIATATIFIMAARRTGWLAVAILFWLLTFFGSVYLGYHYAVDAPVAAILAVICWKIARSIYREPSEQGLGAIQLGTAAAATAPEA